MKKLLVVLCALMLLALGCTSAMAGDTVYSCGEYRYSVLPDGTARIMAYAGKAKTLTIPSELEGHRVTDIGPEAFSTCPDLSSIVLPLSVERINGKSFWNCISLIDIQVSPDHRTLMVLDGVLFERNERCLIYYPHAKAETTYCVPKGIVSIGRSAFEGNRYLTEIIIPDSMICIGNDAFRDCDSLVSVTIPEGVTSIGAGAFISCDSLEHVFIPNSVQTIGEAVFIYCPNVTLTVTPGSYAEQYAIDNSIPYVHAKKVDSAAADTWLCPCGAVNNTNFCPDCGTARPEPEPTCANCGYDPKGDPPNFCPECGTKF
ncbi:MAG: hypothetical protein E7318_13340 [Clostridiales bacterium]|nr:hypothetical protein [Clostridiales bacterium]